MPSNFFDPSAALGGYDQGVSNTMAYDSYLQNYLSQDPSAGMQQPIQPPPEEKPSFMKGLLSNLLSGITGGMTARTGEMAFAAGAANAQAQEAYYKKLQEDEYRKQQEQQLYEMNVAKNNMEKIRILDSMQHADVETQQNILSSQFNLYQAALRANGNKELAILPVGDEASKEEYLKANPDALTKSTFYQVGDKIHVLPIPPTPYGPNEPPEEFTVDGQKLYLTRANQDPVAFEAQHNQMVMSLLDHDQKKKLQAAQILAQQAQAAQGFAGAGESRARANYYNAGGPQGANGPDNNLKRMPVEAQIRLQFLSKDYDTYSKVLQDPMATKQQRADAEAKLEDIRQKSINIETTAMAGGTSKIPIENGMATIPGLAKPVPVNTPFQGPDGRWRKVLPDGTPAWASAPGAAQTVPAPQYAEGGMAHPINSLGNVVVGAERAITNAPELSQSNSEAYQNAVAVLSKTPPQLIDDTLRQLSESLSPDEVMALGQMYSPNKQMYMEPSALSPVSTMQGLWQKVTQ